MTISAAVSSPHRRACHNGKRVRAHASRRDSRLRRAIEPLRYSRSPDRCPPEPGSILPICFPAPAGRTARIRPRTRSH